MAKIELSTGKTVEMREPKVRDMRMVASEKSEAEKEIKLIANLAEMTQDEIDDLGMKDYVKLQKVLAGFLS